VASFNRSNECGITVEAKYAGNTGEIGNKVATAIRNNTLPAIVVGYPSDAARYQQSDKVVDVNPYVNDPAWGLTAEQVADIYPALWEQSAHPELGGQRLGVAYTRSMEVMFYNKTWAAELGFDHAPTTPAEFEEQACKAAQSTGGKGGYVLRDNASAVAAWTFAFGGNLLDENGSYAFSSPAAVEALTMLKRMYDNGCAYFYNKTYPDPELTRRHALFTQGSSAGLWSYEEGMEEAKRGDEFEVLALPHTTVNPRMNAYGMDFLVAKSTPEQQLAAWVFIKWFLTPETQAEWVKISDYFPIGYSAYAYLLDYMDANPHWEETADLLPYTTYEPSLATYQDLRSEISRAFNSIIKGDGSNIQAVMDALTEKANQR
jgi:multiple sugar transport system substrate-binding protein/sn-glycerol 3-phosphate transport system substrate-binding protein